MQKGKNLIVKKQKLINILVWTALAVLVVVVIITGIILHTKKKELADLKDKNEIVSPEGTSNIEENKIFLKNFVIFIDNALKF